MAVCVRVHLLVRVCVCVRARSCLCAGGRAMEERAGKEAGKALPALHPAGRTWCAQLLPLHSYSS